MPDDPNRRRALPRRFRLKRNADLTGVSGEGYVCEGVEWWDGKVTMRWRVEGSANSTGFYDSIEDVVAIHGHDGATVVEWADA